MGLSRLIPLCFLLFLVALFFGFASGFPADVLREQLIREISKQTGMEVSSDVLEIGFPPKVKLDLSVELNHPQMAALVFPLVEVKPVWTSLFTSVQAANIQGQLADGEIDAQVSADDSLQLAISGVRLAPLQKTGNPYRLDGVLRGDLDGKQMSQTGKADAVFSAVVSNLEIFGLEQLSLPEKVVLGQLTAQGAIRGQRLNLEKIVLVGDFVSLNGNGTIQIGTTPQRTRLNLRVTATPGRSFPESLKPLIELSGVKPKADGSYQFRVSGTLGKPVIR